MTSYVYVFRATNSCFCSAIFSTFNKAQAWIESNGVSGYLTEQPIDQSSYDWAIEKQYFYPKSPIDRAPIFIENFCSIYHKQWTYKNGFREEQVSYSLKN